MNRLRELAEGWDYRIDDQGRLCVLDVSRGVSFVYYQQAPASCFADTRPEKPRAEERTLRSPDGSFVMTVWPKDDPPRIEAQIVQQPEEWRRSGCRDVHVVEDQFNKLGAESCEYPQLGFCLWLRGTVHSHDNEIVWRNFKSLQAHNAYLAQLEATVAAMPRLADQFKVGDGVVMAGQMCETARFVAPAVGFRGTIHWISKDSEQGGIADIIADGGELVCAYLINLRHEREDERPAEKKPEPLALDSEMIQRRLRDGEPEPPPVHMTVALVDGRIQVNLDPVEGGGA